MHPSGLEPEISPFFFNWKGVVLPLRLQVLCTSRDLNTDNQQFALIGELESLPLDHWCKFK